MYEFILYVHNFVHTIWVKYRYKYQLIYLFKLYYVDLQLVTKQT